ncbi:hypothetical protein ACI48D_25685 [Massilia sp. LXY-6]
MRLANKGYQAGGQGRRVFIYQKENDEELLLEAHNHRNHSIVETA